MPMRRPIAKSPHPATPYRDRKRFAWVLSLLVPLSAGAGPLLWSWRPETIMLWIPAIFLYLLAPVIDMVLGEDTSNPPESAVPALEADPYYRRVVYALVPMMWGVFVFAAWFSQTADLSWPALLGLTMSTGLVGGFCINLGHETGHKNNGFDKWMAKLILAPTFYGHFTIEHNRGHHRDVATPADPASSRMGEALWTFVFREMPGAFTRAWALERARMRVDGQAFWSLRNEILQPALITIALWTSLCLWLGPQVLWFLVPAAFWANFQLTCANYLEHYGLLRQQTANGRYETCKPHHSWNSNHVFSNWALFHLQRHSDHHAHPLRHYQSLRHFDEAPQLPNGYFGMIPLAMLTPLWFAVMNKRLIKAVQGDPDRINFAPGKRDKLMRQYGLLDRSAHVH